VIDLVALTTGDGKSSQTRWTSVPGAGSRCLPERTTFDSEVERLDETPAFLGEQK
jgi:hypothetical protein